MSEPRSRNAGQMGRIFHSDLGRLKPRAGEKGIYRLEIDY